MTVHHTYLPEAPSVVLSIIDHHDHPMAASPLENGLSQESPPEPHSEVGLSIE